MNNETIKVGEVTYNIAKVVVVSTCLTVGWQR